MTNIVQKDVAEAPEGVSATLNLESFGFAFTVAWFAMILWSPVAVSSSITAGADDLIVHLLRLTALGVVCLVYLVVQFFPFVARTRFVKYVAMVLGVVLSPFSLLGNVLPEFVSLCSAQPALPFIVWAATGFSIAVMMLAWGYDMPTKPSYRQGIVNVASGSVLSGGLFILCAFLERTAASVLTMLIPFVVFAVWLACLRTREGDANSADFECIPASAVFTNVRLTLGKSTTTFIFSYGFIMGVAGSVGTQFELAPYSSVFVGTATLSAGVVMLVVLWSGTLSPTRSMFMWFLPFAVTCLFLLSIANDVGKTALLFAVFFVVNSYNVINTACIDADDSMTLNWGYDLFSCESRTADMFGSALGWAAASFVQFVVDARLVPYCYFLIAAALVGVTIAAFVREEGKPIDEVASANRKKAVDSMLAEWESVCIRLSSQYKLSARESEIFLLLSRGRDRQYIHNLLYISPSTVRTHTYNIYRKMGIHNQQELIDIVENAFMEK